MITENDLFPIGRITKARGVRGEVEIDFTDDIFDRVDCECLFIWLSGLPVPFFWEEYKFKNDHTAIFSFSLVNTTEQAEELVGSEVLFARHYLDELDEDDEITFSRLIGYQISNHKKIIGSIKSIDDRNENVIAYVQLSEGREVLIPLHPDFVLGIDHKKRILSMNLPDGLLSL